MKTALSKWHDYMHEPRADALKALLADDAVFESPVVHTPQHGKDVTFKYLWSAAKVLGNDSFQYCGEWHAEGSAILEFNCTVDGVKINGIDMIWWNEDHLITRFKVMVRPLKAVNMLHAMMGAQLAA
jgi:SnoaL-like domain